MRPTARTRRTAGLVCAFVSVVWALALPVSASEAADGGGPPRELAPDEFRLRIDRGVYSWECPQYIVEILGDGSIECLCRDIGAVPGEYASRDTLRVAWEDVRPLIETVYSDEFLGLGADYDGRVHVRLSDEGNIVVGDLYVRPNPAKRTVVAVRAGEFIKNVTVGASGMPLVIEKLADKVDGLVQQARDRAGAGSPDALE